MDGVKGVYNEEFGDNVDLDEFYDIYDNNDEILQKILLFGCTLIRPFGKEGSLKSLSMKCQRMPNI